jgi:glycosyltransferase involved in cell wall biosynthesis
MTHPDAALIVMPRRSDEWRTAPALWVTAAGWAQAARRRYGAAWVVTPDRVTDPSTAVAYASLDVLDDTGNPFVRSFPVSMRVGAKDVLRMYHAAKFRDIGDRREWRSRSLAFVWQNHDLFACPGRPTARRHGCPLVTYVHAPQVWEARRWGVHRTGWGSLLERVGELPQLREADVVACVSTDVATQLVDMGLPSDRIVVSPMAVDTDYFNPDVSGTEVRSRLGLEEHFVIGWVGTFRSFHGLDDLVEAFARFHRTTPSSRLMLVGDGADRPRIVDLARRLRVPEAVVLPGPLSHGELAPYLAAMDVTVSPAPPDGDFHYSPQKLREYFAVGRPTVAAEIGDIAREITDGDEALFYTPGEVDTLFDQLVRLRDDPELRAALGQRAWKWVLASETWDCRVEQLVGSSAFRAFSSST